MRTSVILVLLAGLPLAACARTGARPREVAVPLAGPVPGPVDASAERRAVYEAILRERFVRPDTPRLVIDPNTKDDGSTTVPRDLRTSVPVVWFSTADWLAIPAPADGIGDVEARWKTFHERYGRVSWIRFEEVVFAPDGRSATVEVGSSWASLAGSGERLRLERRADGWHVVGSQPTWVS